MTWQVRLFLAMDDGSHLSSEHVRCFKVRKVRLTTGGAGHLQLSGQAMPNRAGKTMEVEVRKGVVTMRF
jgi:hypothetical protein